MDQHNIIFSRHANSLLKKDKDANSMNGEDAVYGSFTCQANNVAGPGERCELRVNGPVSALVADTDKTFLVFGGVFVVALLAFILITVVVCRKLSLAKYDAGSIVRTPEPGEATDTIKHGACANGNGGPAINGGLNSLCSPVGAGGGNTTGSTMNNTTCSTGNGNGYGLNGGLGGTLRTEAASLSDEAAGDMYGVTMPLMQNSPQQPPPPPMYQRTTMGGGMPPPLPPGGNSMRGSQVPPSHMMTLDRRVPGSSVNHHHRLLPSGCDVTLNRNSYNNSRGVPAGPARGLRTQGAAYARTPDELWLV